MTTDEKPEIGQLAWIDLTVNDAERIREFYAKVVGWKAEPVSMGKYNDYNMLSPDDNQPVAGICHRRGLNADIPPQWMVYISVANLDQSIVSCKELGGKVLARPSAKAGEASFCIVQDPAGAVLALFERP